MRESLPEADPYRYAILDRDSIFDADVIAFLKVTGLRPKRTSRQSPWQNGTAERWIGSCRREMLDHIIALNEEHLRRLIRDYVRHRHEDRIHDSLVNPAKSAVRRDKTGRRRQPDFAAAPGRAPPSLRVAPSGIEDHRGRIPSLPDDVPRARPRRFRRPHGLWRISTPER